MKFEIQERAMPPYLLACLIRGHGVRAEHQQDCRRGRGRGSRVDPCGAATVRRAGEPLRGGSPARRTVAARGGAASSLERPAGEPPRSRRGAVLSLMRRCGRAAVRQRLG